MNFIARFNREKCFFKPEVSNKVANWQHGSYENVQNFSSISLKLWALGKKSQGYGVCIPLLQYLYV